MKFSEFSEFLEQSAEEFLKKFKFSTSISSLETKLLKDLIMLRDTEILSKCTIDLESDLEKSKEADTLPPPKEPITLVDNRLDNED